MLSLGSLDHDISLNYQDDNVQVIIKKFKYEENGNET